MKKIVFLIIIISFNCVHAQFGQQQVISTDIGGARAVFACDIDGDGDMDVLSASRFDDKVSWFKNTDGLGSFGEEQIIDGNLPVTSSVFAIDLDNDGDMDVLTAARQDYRIVWYENLDGLGDFSSQQIISNDVAGTVYVYAADLDGDGDGDVLSASHLDNKIAWYKNDGLGNFGAQLIITTNALSTRHVIASDIDGDGDMDVIYTDTAGDKVIWHENTDGLGAFGSPRIISSNANGVLSVFATDIDNDGDIDIFSASTGDNKVDWHENLDGQGNFGPPQNISTDPEGERFVFGSDLDNDGDVDLITGYQTNNLIGKVLWYENIDGLGDFGPQQVISSEVEAVRAVFASDLDNDGDMDVLSASLVGANIAWYENFTILSVEDENLEKLTVYPNPINNYLYIDSNSILINKIEIFDILGRKALTKEEDFNPLDVSHLKSGLLFIKIETENNGILTKKIIKE